MKTHYQKTFEFYQKRAEKKNGQYDPPRSLPLWAQQKVRRLALEFLAEEKIKPNDEILDAGCAKGDFARMIASRYPWARLLGIDFSYSMIKLARQEKQEIKNLRFRYGNLLNPNLSAQRFSATFCLDVLHHIIPSDLKKTLTGLARVTEKILIIEIKNKGLAKKITKKIGGLRSIQIYETTTQEVSKILKQSGFVLKKERPILGLKFLSPISILKFKKIK